MQRSIYSLTRRAMLAIQTRPQITLLFRAKRTMAHLGLSRRLP
jgi:hypothetical protein